MILICCFIASSLFQSYKKHLYCDKCKQKRHQMIKIFQKIMKYRLRRKRKMTLCLSLHKVCCLFFFTFFTKLKKLTTRVHIGPKTEPRLAIYCRESIPTLGASAVIPLVISLLEHSWCSFCCNPLGYYLVFLNRHCSCAHITLHTHKILSHTSKKSRPL